MEEGGFDFWPVTPRAPEAAVASPLPPPLSSDCWEGINDQFPSASPPLMSADGSCWALDLSMHGHGGLPDEAGGRRLLDGTSSGAYQQQLAPWGMDMMADMLRTAEECGKADEAASRVWSEEEHRELLYRLQWYAAKHDSASMCIHIAFHLPNKTAKDVALRWRWLQDKEKIAKKAELVQKDPSSGVKVNKGQGTKGAKKNNNMYPLSKEALDCKSTRELLRDSHIFMQQIEKNIKTGELGNDTADYFYYVKTNMDAIVTRGKEFCRISIPMPPIDEEGLEEILQQSRHSSSAGKKGA